uniref:Uncharacterized protein n=1 Tax=Attheya septentrionalis TaxID=420275 RepID=A0A7S2U7Z7_9STRA|mmetsp:Transcript_11756/g.21399  ORF Transcript_11756/g.21399 Transcript_11756/m.21399 type:complete len:208 (+) Transcript_11756:162-785(+)|eukprot:CAMPEP_0198290570 /NCGR_PEP_ID=MMETSP1449-20131203/8379_1 /TAXON_ID=420275 /ORGANISM="Attheya septentrionalis, Strain CCMP2084" /LENGTH=207 /DNA_ID=CAMNT_0043989085 /DNA_START=148 /DNA_END=771 /DNA_ORIENTATION=+
MKSVGIFLVSFMMAILVSVKGFAPVSIPLQRRSATAFVSSQSQSQTQWSLYMSDFGGSDFPSAMPPKPVLTMEEKMYESATDFIASLEGRLKEGVVAPPELEALREARDGKAPVNEVATKIYELMIEQGMLYDQDPETGLLGLTDFDISAHLEVPEVKQEFSYLYKYGMNMISTGLVDVETAKDIVSERLIKRTGLTPEEFDTWLGY